MPDAVRASVGRQDRPLAGILYMVGGMVLLVLSDASAKWLTAHYPVTQIVVLRGLVIVGLLLLVGLRTGAVRVVSVRGHLLRGVFATASGYLFIFGLAHLPLADASAAAFAGPLFLTALAGPVLGERVGWRRWSAVLLGFAGVLVMLQPTGEGLNWAILLPVAAACCGALRDLVTRHISITDNATSILLTTNAMLVLAGALFVSRWHPVEPLHLAVMAVSGLLIGSAHYMHIECFRLAEAATIAPFRYTSIVWGVLFGFLFFAQLPGPWVIAGAALVIASGLYIMHREHRRRKQAARDRAA
jgi:drug/metabolite transporter (DMT)-like permease